MYIEYERWMKKCQAIYIEGSDRRGKIKEIVNRSSKDWISHNTADKRM